LFRTMLINPVLVVLAAATGVAVCRGAGANPHIPEMLVASGICLAATALAMIPIQKLPADANHAALFQAAFLGSVIHMGLCIALGAVILFWRKPGSAFIYWLLAMYWLTLIGLCVTFVKRLRVPAKPMGTATI